MENQNNIALGQIDSPNYPKLKTRTYLMDREGVSLINYKIINTPDFGKIGKGFLGNQQVDLNHMRYDINPNFIEKLRTARDEQGESLSRAYFFNKDNNPLTLFVFVKKPWKEIISRKKRNFAVKAYVRSPNKNILSKARLTLSKILEDESNNSII